MDQNQAVETITKFIQAHWSDQKLAEVYAFNEDGKMTYGDSCGCLLGVSLSDILHTSDVSCRISNGWVKTNHYFDASMSLSGAWKAETAYNELATSRDPEERFNERQKKMSVILKAEMDRRESKHDNAIIANLQAELDAEEAACLI